MSNLLSHAETELEIAQLLAPDSVYDGMIGKSVQELMKVFSGQGHSEASAHMTVEVFSQLALFKPLQPITGHDAEWVEVEGGLFQNTRCSAVFKRDEKSYFLDAIIWRGENGGAFNGTVDGVTSRQYITFPFTPKTFYVDIDKHQQIVDRSQLTEAHTYYGNS